MSPASRLVCTGCGAEPAPDDPYPFRCPGAGRDDGVDHVLRRELDLSSVTFPSGPAEPNPFIRYRTLLHPYHTALAAGLADAEFCELVRRLDDRIAVVDGHGFRATPFARRDELSSALGFSDAGGVWVKDETGNVSGSHKARHLFDVLLQLEVAERLGWSDPAAPPDLAIASCGNAALAAAVLAAAGERRLRVFVPPDADPAVVGRLEELDARIEVCERQDGISGDPTYLRLLDALDAGALPFTCQGNLNGLAVEGGLTLGYELVSELSAAGTSVDRVIVQVGGGALASACFEALRDARRLGALAALPRIDTVQTEGAWPLRRAFEELVAGVDTTDRASALRFAAAHRAQFMWPWETEPRSIAHGILDDETYDWLAVVEGMLTTGGAPLVVGDETLAVANRLGRRMTGIDVDPTGSAGLAGLLVLLAADEVAVDDRVLLLFTGVARATRTDSEERTQDEKLRRQGHPVAQGL
jgi:threonine synthase